MKIKEITNEFYNYNPSDKEKKQFYTKEYMEWFLENSKFLGKLDINQEIIYDLYLKTSENQMIYFAKNNENILGFISIIEIDKNIYQIKIISRDLDNNKSLGVPYALVNYVIKKERKNLITDDTRSDDGIRFINNLKNKSFVDFFIYDKKTKSLYDKNITSKDKKISDDGKTIILSPNEEKNNNFDYDINDNKIDRVDKEKNKSRFYWFMEESTGNYYPREILEERYEIYKDMPSMFYKIVANAFDYTKYDEES